MAQTGPKISVAIADTDHDHRARAHALLMQDPQLNVVGTASQPREGLLLLDTQPNVFLLATNVAGEETTSMVKQLLHLAPNTLVLLVSDPEEKFDLKRAVLAGARGIVQQPLSSDELLATIHEIYDSEIRRRQRIEEHEQVRNSKANNGQVIVVFSPKGGVGCTLLACNLAIALQQVTGKKVALADYSLQFGTIGTMLNLQSAHSAAELMPHYEDLDSTILDDVMVKHSSGIHVLLPPRDLEEVESITTEGLVGVLDALRKDYDFVVVDTWHAIEDAILAVMELADILLLVTTPEVPALNTARRFLDMLKNYPQLRHKPQLVVNRLPSKGQVPLTQIERSLGLSAIATLPSDGRAMTTSINEGIPTVQRNPGHGFAQHVSALARLLAPRPSSPNGRVARGSRLKILGRKSR